MSEKQKKMLRFGKIFHWVSLLIGALTIVLPLLFWKHIPDQIPMHFGGDGMTDRMGDKSGLILLFFVVFMVMGVMSICVYFVKSNAVSQYAKAEEVEMVTTVYPMLLIMNFMMMCMFAYIMTCTVSGRNLGRLFLPIVLVGVFAPVLYYLRKNAKVKAKYHQELEEYKRIEKTVEGECYRAKVDWWLWGLFVVILGGEYGLFVKEFLQNGKIDWILLSTSLFVTVLIVPIFFIKHMFYPDHLLVACAIYGKERIPYRAIVNMKETHNPLSSAAPSIDRIQIDYVINGVQRMILISPVRKKEFMRKVEEKRKIIYNEKM